MAGLTREDIDYLIIHQGNYRILEAGAKFARVPMDKVFANIHKYGNTSAASVPIALHEAHRKARSRMATRCCFQLRGRGHLGGHASGVVEKKRSVISDQWSASQ